MTLERLCTSFYQFSPKANPIRARSFLPFRFPLPDNASEPDRNNNYPFVVERLLVSVDAAVSLERKRLGWEEGKGGRISARDMFPLRRPV